MDTHSGTRAVLKTGRGWSLTLEGRFHITLTQCDRRFYRRYVPIEADQLRDRARRLSQLGRLALHRFRNVISCGVYLLANNGASPGIASNVSVITAPHGRGERINVAARDGERHAERARIRAGADRGAIPRLPVEIPPRFL